MKKIIPRQKLVNVLLNLKKKGKKIGFTNGVFDILHAGHVTYLEKARKLCDVLVVSLNTDDSVKKLKGPERPINTLEDRQKVIASLSFVDYVTSHAEESVGNTIKLLKPDLYIKGGDYKSTDLKSKPFVVSYGGKVVIIPMVKGKSTTKIIDKISVKKNKAVFVDKDGTINEEIEYLQEPKKFKLLPKVIEGLQLMKKKGYKIVIVTNQPGIGLGYFTKEDFFKVNKEMLRQFSNNKIMIDKIYFCPHSMSEKCSCRKPGIGMLKRAEKELSLDLSKSYVIGDQSSDMLAGQKAGCKTILVKTGQKGLDNKHKAKPDFIVKNLLEAANLV